MNQTLIRHKQQITQFNLSETVQNIQEALSIKINQMVYDLRRQKRDIITLSLGESYFDIPIFDFSQIDFNKGFHYCDSQGIPSLRKKLIEYYENHYHANIKDNEILITAGSKAAIYLALLATINRGDEVLFHEPAWVSYPHQISLVGGIPKNIPYDANMDNISEYFTPKTKMLIINNPNNPSGRLYTEVELRKIHHECQKRSIYLMVDEAYSDFVLDDEFFTSGRLSSDKNGIIIVNSLSKNMGMSGWRVGYVISSPELIHAILKLNQHIITCAPSVLLYYMSKYFDKIISHTLPQVKAVVKKRRQVEKLLDDLNMSCLKGSATFYLFVNIGQYPGTSDDFAMELLQKFDIAVVPGSAYGESTKRFVRISIGTESLERIESALITINCLIHK